MTIENTLKERGARYGDFAEHARITQTIKTTMRQTEGWSRLSFAQREAAEMIAHKLGRILAGDPDWHDSWHDIEGYARLVSQGLEHKGKLQKERSF